MAEKVKPLSAFAFAIQLLLGIVIQSVIYCGGYLLCERIPVPVSMDYGSRIAYTLRWTLPMVLFYMVTIQQTARRRGATAANNPLSGNEHLIQTYKNILTNTLEQLFASLLLMLIATTYFDSPDMIKIIPVYAITFTVGRVLFAIGYMINPMYRGTGIIINFFSSLLLAGYVIYLTYTRGMVYGLGTVYHSSGDYIARKDEL